MPTCCLLVKWLLSGSQSSESVPPLSKRGCSPSYTHHRQEGLELFTSSHLDSPGIRYCQGPRRQEARRAGMVFSGVELLVPKAVQWGITGPPQEEVRAQLPFQVVPEEGVHENTD